jgi:hypothetical protein
LWLRAARLRRSLGDNERALELLARIEREARASEAGAEARELLPEWRRK